jgi:hypothetical protein
MKKRETMEQAAAARRCPVCLAWFMTKAQRDAHQAKKH